MSSSSSPSPDDTSIWDILNTLETKLIQSTHSLLPQVVDTSYQILGQLHSLSGDAYQKSIELATNHLDFFLKNQPNNPLVVPTTASLPIQQQINNSSNLIRSIHNTQSDQQQHHYHWFIKIFKPRRIIILAGIFFSSRFTLRLFVNSNYFDRWTRSNPSLAQRIPSCLLASKKSRKNKAKKLLRRSSSGTSGRLDIVVVLGADPGSAGNQIALHLTQIGYIVIASVSRAEYVAPLEKDGLGWIKALVLDPLIVNQTRAFNRSLAACLNLKFPINSTFDSTINNHQSSLIGFVNCLPISFPDVLRPVESIEIDDHLVSPIQSIAGLSLEVIKVVLPMIRNSIDKFGADDAVILTLFPTKTTSVPLPYLSSSVIANQTLETLMKTLRREILISNSDSNRSIRIINEKIGTFRPSQYFTGSTSIHHSTPTHQPVPSLPIHLHSIYAPSLSRRIGILNLPTTGLAIQSPNGNPISQLIKRVQDIIQSPKIKNGSDVSIGKEVWKFYTIQTFLPNFLVENWLLLTENLNGWVRKKVISEIDLESNENLEKLIEKRKFSSRSQWKNGVFFQQSDHELLSVTDELKQVQEQEQVEEKSEVVVEDEKVTENEKVEEKVVVVVEEEGDVTLQIDSTELPKPPELITIETNDDSEDKEKEEETGSVIDKGDGDTLNHSFVGSEVDWKEMPAPPSVVQS